MPALDPSIAGGLQPTTQLNSPLQSIGALMQLRGQMSEIALRNQQIEQSRQQIEQSKQAAENLRQEAANRQRTVESTARMTKILQDPNTHLQIQAGNLQSLWDAGVSPDVALPAVENLGKFYQQAATLKNTQADYYSKARGQIADTLGSIDLNDPNAAAHLNSFRDTFSKQFPEYASHLPQFLEGPGLKEQVDNAIANNAVGKAIIDAHLAQGKERAQTAEADAQTKKFNQDAENLKATLPEIEAKAATEKLLSDFRAKNGGLSPAEVETARHNKKEEGIQAGELGIKQRTFDATFGPNALNQGLAGVQPHLIAPATAAAVKAGEEYATAKQVSDSMKTMLDLAGKGNKAAGSNLPLVGVETLNAINGIKRINGAEIAQYGSAGSLLDHIQGRVGKLVAGQPIPQDVMDDIRALHDELDKGAKTKYADKVRIINQTYNSKFTPVGIGDASPQGGSTGGHSVGDTVQIGKKKIKISAIHPDGTFDGAEVP